MLVVDVHETKSNFIIYLLRNKINNKIYIGQTKMCINERLRKHIKPSKDNNQIITKAIRKYGEENFVCEILFYAKSFEEMNIKEVEFIFEYKCLDKKIGYNVDKGGNNFETSSVTKEKLRKTRTGKKMSEKTKKKISNSTQGKNNHFYGKTHSDDTKKKISEVHMGKIVSDETKLKMSKSQKGRKHNDKTKRKISESHIGIKSSETPLIIIDENFDILKNFNNVTECAKYLELNKRTVYSAYNKLTLTKKHKIYILKSETFDNDLILIKERLHK